MKKVIMMMTLIMCFSLFSCTQKTNLNEEQKYTYSVSVVTSIYTYPQLTSENPYIINNIDTFEDYSPSQIRTIVDGLNTKDTSEISFENSDKKGIKIQIRNCQIIDSIK